MKKLLSLALIVIAFTSAFGEFVEVNTNLVGVSNSCIDWGDYDNDGDLDVLLTGLTSSGPSVFVTYIYRNDGNAVFTNINAGLQGLVGKAEWGDFDNDGDLDIAQMGVPFATPTSPVTRIYRNDGNGVFTDINAGLIGVYNGFITWGDCDNDGDLDILLGGQLGDESTHVCKIYRNNGDSTFTDINAGLPGTEHGSGMWGDYDCDGDLDILLTGMLEATTYPPYFEEAITKIFRNDGLNIYTDINVGLPGVFTGTARWGNIDNDSDLDVILTGAHPTTPPDDEFIITEIYQNIGYDTFTDLGAGLPAAYWSCADWADYDLDGYSDIALEGSIDPELISRIYHNNGNSTFSNIEAQLTGIQNGCIAWGDYDSDGDPDLLLAGDVGSGLYITKLYRNYETFAIISPNGGEVWEGGSTQTISWDAPASVDYINILLSTDAGANWQQLNDDPLVAGLGAFSVTVPEINSIQCLIRIEQVGHNSVFDESNGYFTICILEIITPNGGECWAGGSSQTISWDAPASVDCINILLSTDAGVNWQQLNEHPLDAGLEFFVFTVPEINSTQCLIRIEQVMQNSVFDESNGYFTISTFKLLSPNGGECWVGGSTQTISWDAPDSVDFINILLSTDAGVNWQQLNNVPVEAGLEAFLFTVPYVNSWQCLVRIEQVGQNSIFDESNEYFSIGVDVLMILSPNGGECWTSGSIQTISWVSPTYMHGVWHNILLSTDAGVNWQLIGGYQFWNSPISLTVPYVQSSECLVRVEIDSNTFDVSDSFFTIDIPFILLVPNGGESWTGGSLQTITWWAVSSVDYVNLILSTDAGVNWQQLNDVPVEAGLGAFSFPVPEINSTQCLIRIEQVGQNSVFDVSDGYFTISTFKLLTPNGGECWAGGSIQTISWDAPASVDYINILLSTDAGANWQQLNDVPVEADLEAFSFAVPEVNSTQCLVRIEQHGQNSIFDESNGYFTIYSDLFTEIDLGLYDLDVSSVDWGDYDSDGDTDILITGKVGMQYVTRIYANMDGTSFVDINAGIVGVNGSADWGDLDNDGDLDIALSGWGAGDVFTSGIYRNEGNGIFTDTNANLTSIAEGIIMWVDYNNDGGQDIFMSGAFAPGLRTTKIYRNNGDLSFTEINAGMVGVNNCSADWGDFDLDGDQDLLLMGQMLDGQYQDWNFMTKVYRNDGMGIFTDINAGLQVMGYGSANWADYDNDGWLDILISGTEWFVECMTRLYRNNGDQTFSYVDAGLTNMQEGSTAWGDFDNDGNLDLLMTGWHFPWIDCLTELYHNTGNGSFISYEVSFQNVKNGDIAWADFDNDEDLDVFLSGRTYGRQSVVRLHRNNTLNPNSPPSAPTNLTVTDEGAYYRLSWEPASDVQTPTTALGYALRVGTTPGGCEIMPPMSDSLGNRKVVQRGLAGSNCYWKIDAQVLSDLDNYFWSVQAIDGAYAGSGFSDEYARFYLHLLSPNAGGSWLGGSSMEVEWFAHPTITAINIYLSTDNGLSWSLLTPVPVDASLGLLSVALPQSAAQQCLIKVENTNDTNQYDISDTSFSICDLLFNEIPIGLLGVADGCVEWGDYDNDNDLDLLLTGASQSGLITKIYRNDGSGSYLDINASLPGSGGSSADWGDYDNDGDMDLIISGVNGIMDTRVYRNEGGDVFVNINAGLPGVVNGISTWADYDNDGDLDIFVAGESDRSKIAKIFRNDDNSIFYDINVNIPGIDYCSVSWGDYDNDLDLDLALTGSLQDGSLTTSIYNNQGNGIFADAIAGLPGLGSASIAWGDCDADGDLDLLLNGASMSAVVRNDQGAFSIVDLGLQGFDNGSADWGDYDCDGDLDILLTGHYWLYYQNYRVTSLLRNDGNFCFTEVGFGFPGLDNSNAAWGDCDNDGDLDLLLTGYASGPCISRLYRNDNIYSNTAPTPPSNLNTGYEGDYINLDWDLAIDGQTQQNGLSYALMVGSQPGGQDICAPMSSALGYRRIARNGNSNGFGGWKISLADIGHVEEFYWSVQAIDTSYKGSPFAGELSVLNIKVLSPNGGEDWQAGSSQMVTWIANPDIDSINVYLSLDFGNTWIIQNSDPVDASLGSFQITAPFLPSENCMIQIESSEQPLLYDVSNLVFSISGYPVLELLTDPPLNFGIVYLGDQSESHGVKLLNSGTAPLAITSLSFFEPLSAYFVDNYSLPAYVCAGDSTIIPVIFRPEYSGEYIDSLVVYSNANNLPQLSIQLRGLGVIAPPKPPENVQITTVGENIVISWDPVTQTIYNTPIIPDYYLVFYNGSGDFEGLFYYLGRSWITTYIHDGADLHADNFFYYVRAYKNLRRESLRDKSYLLIRGMKEEEVFNILDN